jgi:hypothetical protein
MGSINYWECIFDIGESALQLVYYLEWASKLGLRTCPQLHKQEEYTQIDWDWCFGRVGHSHISIKLANSNLLNSISYIIIPLLHSILFYLHIGIIIY